MQKKSNNIKKLNQSEKSLTNNKLNFNNKDYSEFGKISNLLNKHYTVPLNDLCQPKKLNILNCLNNTGFYFILINFILLILIFM